MFNSEPRESTMGQNSRANKSNSEGNKSQSLLNKIEGKKHNKQGIPIRGKRKTIGLMEVLWNTPPQPSLLCFSPNPLFTFFPPVSFLLTMSINILPNLHQSGHQLLHHFSGSYSYLQRHIYYYYLYFFMVIHIQGYISSWVNGQSVTLTKPNLWVTELKLIENGTLDLS